MQSHFRDFHRHAFGGWCLVFALALPATGLAKPAMSLQEAIRLATVRAPLLEARRAGVTAAQEDAARAGALPDPMLTVGIDNLPVTGADAFDSQADIPDLPPAAARVVLGYQPDEAFSKVERVIIRRPKGRWVAQVTDGETDRHWVDITPAELPFVAARKAKRG